MDYAQEAHDGITIWYDRKIMLQPGYDTIEISLRSLFFMKWLELVGAKVTEVHSEVAEYD